MATDGGPNIERDGLVFGMDTGYGVANNSTATRFYKGKPTTNEFVFSNFTPSGYGGDGVVQTGMLDPFGTTNNPIYRKTGKLRFGVTGGQDIGSLYYGTTSTFSIYLRHVFGQPQTTSVEFDINDRLDSINYVGNLGANMTYDLTDSKTPTSISSMYIYNDRTTQGQGIFTNFIITEHTTVPTGKVLYTSGTRLDTQSIIDLKKTTDIDVSDISFDSIGQPTFDGTDDHITINNPDISADSFTIQMVVKPDSYSNNPMLINPNSTGIDQYIRIWSNGKIGGVFVAAADTSGDTCKSITSLSTSEYTHFTITKSTSTIKVYINGNLETTVTPTVSAAAWTGTWDIGQRVNNTYNYNGVIPILKVYNTPISADEVKINFNSIKNRFGI